MSLFDWDKVTTFIWWDGMPAVLIREEGSSKAFSILDPKRDWREVNFVDVFSNRDKLGVKTESISKPDRGTQTAPSVLVEEGTNGSNLSSSSNILAQNKSQRKKDRFTKENK